MGKLGYTEDGYIAYYTSWESPEGLEIDLEVLFDHQPYEAMTYDYPGCDEQADVYEVNIVNGPEICLLPEYKDLMEEEILDALENERDEEIVDRYDYLGY